MYLNREEIHRMLMIISIDILIEKHLDSGAIGSNDGFYDFNPIRMEW